MESAAQQVHICSFTSAGVEHFLLTKVAGGSLELVLCDGERTWRHDVGVDQLTRRGTADEEFRGRLLRGLRREPPLGKAGAGEIQVEAVGFMGEDHIRVDRRLTWTATRKQDGIDRKMDRVFELQAEPVDEPGRGLRKLLSRCARECEALNRSCERHAERARGAKAELDELETVGAQIRRARDAEAAARPEFFLERLNAKKQRIAALDEALEQWTAEGAGADRDDDSRHGGSSEDEALHQEEEADDDDDDERTQVGRGELVGAAGVGTAGRGAPGRGDRGASSSSLAPLLPTGGQPREAPPAPRGPSAAVGRPAVASPVRGTNELHESESPDDWEAGFNAQS